MKITLVFLAVLGLACAASIDRPQPKQTRTLNEDWIEFVSLIPRGPIINILVTYLATDSEVQGMILHLISPEVIANIGELDREIDFLNLVNWMEEHQLEGTYDALNIINSFFNWGVIVPNVPRDGVTKAGDIKTQLTIFDIIDHVQKATGESRGWLQMWQAIVNVWPAEEILRFHARKMQTSPEYIQLFSDFQSAECRELVSKVVVLPSWQRIVASIERIGMNSEAIGAWISKVIGWN